MQRWNSSIYRGIIYILTRNFCVTFQSFPGLASNLLTLDPPPPKFTTMPVWICSTVCPLITGSTGDIVTKWCDEMAIHAHVIWSGGDHTGNNFLLTNGSSSTLVMEILFHEAWYVKQLVSIHKVRPRRLRVSSALHLPIVVHRSPRESAISSEGINDVSFVYCGRLYGDTFGPSGAFERTIRYSIGRGPLLDATYALDSVANCLLYLQDVYSDYFSDLEDRRFFLAKSRNENERFDRFVKACVSFFPTSLVVYIDIINLRC